MADVENRHRGVELVSDEADVPFEIIEPGLAWYHKRTDKVSKSKAYTKGKELDYCDLHDIIPVEIVEHVQNPDHRHRREVQPTDNTPLCCFPFWRVVSFSLCAGLEATRLFDVVQ